MELYELFQRVKKIFNANTAEELKDAIKKSVEDNNTSIYSSFKTLVGDLSQDWLQKIYQYYLADREEKKQDFTPENIAVFMSKLSGEVDCIVDMCAGSGALTIQKWADGFDGHFILHEIDEQVIYFLLFNLALRNMQATVNMTDVLQDEIVRIWRVDKSEEFSAVKEVTL